MTPTERRLLNKIHDYGAWELTTNQLDVVIASRGGYVEDDLAREQAREERRNR